MHSYPLAPSYLIFPDNERHEAFYQKLPWTPDSEATRRLREKGIEVTKAEPKLMSSKPVYKVST